MTARDAHPAIAASQFWTLAWEQASTTNPRMRSDSDEELFWKEAAPTYDRTSPLAQHSGALMADIYPLLTPADSLIEIGSGTGAFTKLLGARVHHIIAVEPSAAMRAELVAAWNCSTPLEVISKKWEDCRDLQADVLFSANAVYRIRDMANCLSQMNETARRHIVLVQTIGLPYAPPLRVALDGGSVEQERAYAMANILSELGIAFRFRTYRIDRGFGPINEVALIDWRPTGRKP